MMQLSKIPDKDIACRKSTREADMPLDKINALLPRLNRDELRVLSGRIKALIELTPEDGSIASNIAADDESLVLGCIAEQLSRMSVEFVSVAVLRNQRGIASFRSKLPGLMKFVSSGGRNRIEQRAILMMGIELLYDHLVKQQLPITAWLLMSHVHRIPSVLNDAFPGYARAGLLSWIVKKRQSDGQTTKAVARPPDDR